MRVFGNLHAHNNVIALIPDLTDVSDGKAEAVIFAYNIFGNGNGFGININTVDHTSVLDQHPGKTAPSATVIK